MQVDILSATPLKKKVLINIWFLTLQMKTKSYLKNTTTFFNRIRKKIKKISGNKWDYEKDYMKNKFNSTFFKRRVSIIL